MKNIIITIFLLVITNHVWSQTNTFPSSGNVGIGTTSPIKPLHIVSTDADILLQSNSDNWTELALYNAGSTTPIRTTIGASIESNNFGYVGTNTLHNFSIRTNNIVRATFDKSGNLAIGTVSTGHRLEINGDNSGNDGIKLENIGTGNIQLQFLYNGSNNGALTMIKAWQNGNHAGLAIHDGASNLLNLRNGFVGIGTDDPQSKLAVEGQIRATEVKVLADISVPDYVFEPNYELRTLQETKEYINENKHLPEIPSATEIGENGIDLGDMNMRLLKKIEELTLYQIELMEKLEQQNAELQEVKKELQELKK